MWVIRGPFDGDEGQELNTESESGALVYRVSSVSRYLESKFLKPGKHYVLGRKGADLLISSKKISREHVTFTLSDFPASRVVSKSRLLLPGFISILVQDDVMFKPKARLENPRNKPITIQRGINLITLDPSSNTELWDGDAIHLVGGVTVMSVIESLKTRSRLSMSSLVGSPGIHFAVDALQPLR